MTRSSVLVLLCVLWDFLAGGSNSTEYKSDGITCGNEYECANETIFNNGSYNVYVEGYKSNAGIKASIIVNGSEPYHTIIDDSSFGCYKIGSIYANYKNYIGGSNGMMYGKFTFNQVTDKQDGALLFGYGTNSLTNATITSTPNDKTSGSYSSVICGGASSCAGANISNVSMIQGFGSQSLVNATIIIDGTVTKSSDIQLGGNFAARNASIHCLNNGTCNVTCYGNGCYGLSLYCDDSSVCNVNCNQSMSIYCPIYNSNYNNDYNYDGYTYAPSYLDIDIADRTLANAVNCQLPQASTFGDNKEYPNATEIVNVNGNICCQTAYICKNVKQLWTRLHDIVCSGRGSCSCGETISDCKNNSINNDYNSSMAASYDSNIYCTGYYACQYKIILGSDTNMVYCGGSGSCANSIIHYAEQLFCAGSSQSCYGTIINSVSNIYFTYYETVGMDVTINSMGAALGLSVYFGASGTGLDVVVYCQHFDTCNIYCLVNGACDNTRTIINGCNNFIVQCNVAQGIECPFVNQSATCPDVDGGKTSKH